MMFIISTLTATIFRYESEISIFKTRNYKKIIVRTKLRLFDFIFYRIKPQLSH